MAAGGFYFWQRSAPDAPPLTPVPRPEAAAKRETSPTPQFRFPVPPAGQSTSLPSLEQSDSSMRKLLATLFGRKVFEELFSQQDIIRRIVATVDNLAREKVAQRLMPLRSARGPMLLKGEGEQRTISPQNASRYEPYIAMAEAVDAKALVVAYIRHYPLFQQAYGELGYPTEYFNDRLVAVIDHLLAAPNVDGPVQLVQRKVLYEFADPEMEARSAGQKIMIRIGPANSARLRSTLRDIRRELTPSAPKS